MLFAAISRKVPQEDMNLVSSNYELFKVYILHLLKIVYQKKVTIAECFISLICAWIVTELKIFPLVSFI